jgi:predicted permease
LRLLVAIGPGTLPRLSEIGLDVRALAFTFVISLVAGLLCGAIPALKYAGPRIANVLAGASRTVSASRERHRASNTLVAVQVALAMVLLIAAGLMIRTFQALRAVDPGFTGPEQLQTFSISIPGTQVREPVRVFQMQKQIMERIAAIPGVNSVAFAGEVPMQGTPPDWDVILAEGQTIGAEKELPPLRLFNPVSPGMFGTIGTKLVAGRDYTWSDLEGRRRFVIVSENLAREMWGTAARAIGKRMGTAIQGAPLYEVIGVVQDIRENGVQEAAPAIVYWPVFNSGIYAEGRDNAERGVTFVVRTPRAASASFLTELHQAVWSVNSSLPLASIRTMSDLYQGSLARNAFTLVMLAIAGSMALVLGIVGIYGVISYTVSQRRREIGIRLALGAQQRQIRRMYVTNALYLAIAGILGGLAISLALMPLAKSLIFGISPLDVSTYAAVAVLLAMAAALASYLPAYRASRVNPAETLR